MNKLADRLNRLSVSATLAMSQKSQELKAQGVDVINMSVGEPDFNTPDNIKEVAKKAIDDNWSRYSPVPGYPSLRKAIVEKLKKENGLEFSEAQISVSNGAKQAVCNAIMALVNPGDEVIVPAPYWVSYPEMVKLADGTPVIVSAGIEQNFKITGAQLESVITPKTKMIILTHPNNPTTTVYNRASLEALRNVCVKHDLVLVCDQAFEDFTYDHEFITPAALEGMFERTITVFSVSKGLGLSGFRVGYIVTSDVIMDTMYANAVGVLGATHTASQRAVIAAFEDPSYMKVFEEAYDVRRHKAYEIINSIPNVSMALPESGFLCWINVSKLGNSSDIVSYLVKEAKVSINDGVNYGPGGEGHLRIVLGVYKDNQKVFDALERIKAALIKYQQDK